MTDVLDQLLGIMKFNGVSAEDVQWVGIMGEKGFYQTWDEFVQTAPVGRDYGVLDTKLIIVASDWYIRRTKRQLWKFHSFARPADHKVFMLDEFGRACPYGEDKTITKPVPFATLEGKTIQSIQVGKFLQYEMDEIRFRCTDGSEYRMYHQQDCCENVSIEDIDGDIQRLIGQQIVVAEERTSNENPPLAMDADDSFTWTFYVLRTNLDSVTIRWFGTSNGYYSETVSFQQVARQPDMEDKTDAQKITYLPGSVPIEDVKPGAKLYTGSMYQRAVVVRSVDVANGTAQVEEVRGGTVFEVAVGTLFNRHMPGHFCMSSHDEK